MQEIKSLPENIDRCKISEMLRARSLVPDESIQAHSWATLFWFERNFEKYFIHAKEYMYFFLVYIVSSRYEKGW